MIYNPDFLKRLDEHREKTIYARIISLTMDENPIEQIEGQITTGSINVDGNSAVRRTCSITMVAQDVKINEYYWGLNTKFRLEIGVENKIDNQYPDVIWFKMGTYVITSFNASLATNSYTISLQGKDKMCLLNGDVGGTINARTDFGTYDFTNTETGVTTNYKYPIKKIIWDAVHAYAGEPFHNIIINDLDELGLELLDYKYDVPLYLLRRVDDDNEAIMITMDPSGWYDENGSITPLDSDNIKYMNLMESMVGQVDVATKVHQQGQSNKEYWVSKIEYGQTAGYRTCDLVYAGDLIANIGESVTSVLDKIKNMLGQFEYFYDLDGRFVFQRQKSLVNTVWTPIKDSGDKELYVESLAAASNSMYDFHGSILISSFSNNPNLLNLKNDYTVWGVKKGVTGQEYPIHMRYAIDNKPEIYADFNGKVWTTLSEDEIDTLNASRTKTTIRAAIYSLWENFERDVNLYPTVMWNNPDSDHPYIYKDEPWWAIREWAEYYKILFGEYPGNVAPRDYMREYTTQSPNSKQNNRLRFNCITMSYNLDFSTSASEKYFYNTDTAQIFYFRPYGENGPTYLASHQHGRCSHTYGSWLDIEDYVNGVPKEDLDHEPDPNNSSDWIYEPFDEHYPWSRTTGYMLFCRPEELRDLRDHYGLYKIVAYCYNPQIPPDLREAELARLEQLEEFHDMYDKSNYNFGIDWRELIYRMAIDYRLHNHDDDFEVRLAANNSQWDLYPKGVTGYEQYYTDMEGFWRELYNPQMDDSEEEKAHIYNYTIFDRISNFTENDLKNVYIQGVYKPIGKKVTAVAEELQKIGVTYVKDEETGKQYPKIANQEYWESETKGFTFSNTSKLGSSYTTAQFIEKAKAGKLYIREIPSILNLYKPYSSSDRNMYLYMDLENYVYNESSNPRKHFLKRVDNSDPQNPYYELITDATSLDSKAKSGSYVLSSEGEVTYNQLYEKKQLIFTNLDECDTFILAFNASDSLTQQDFDNFSTEFAPEVESILKEKLSDKLTNSPTVAKLKTKISDNTMTKQEKYKLLKDVEKYIQEVYTTFEIKLGQNKNLDYVLYYEELQNNLTLDSGYIYDSSNLYCMNDVIQNSVLRNLYFKNNRLIESTIQYGLHNDGTKIPTRETKTKLNYYLRDNNFYDATEENVLKRFWRKDVFESPQSLIFWFDFLVGDGDLRQFTTQAIGDRPKAVNDNNIKSIYYRDTPKVIFTTPEKLAGMDADQKTGYSYLTIPEGYENMFSISTQGIDAKNKIDELLYQFSYCTESITIQAIPVYYLDVNKRISVFDPESGINGEYVVSKITFPLAYNGMMSITATKAPENSVTEREE